MATLNHREVACLIYRIFWIVRFLFDLTLKENVFYKTMHVDDNAGMLNVNISVENSGLNGRPRFRVSHEQLQALHGDCGMRWSDIARTLGVSERTVRRRRHEFGMPVEEIV